MPSFSNSPPAVAMKLLRRHLFVTVALGASLALNLVFLTDHARRGTFRRLFVRMDLAEARADRSAYQAAMEARYRQLPTVSGGVVFAGDSLIFQGPWSEFYSTIHNRGIPNETSALLLGRLDEVTRVRPGKLILLTGANDLTQGVPIPQLVRNYRSILAKARADSPGTDITVVGLLPINPDVPDAPRYTKDSILEANRQLEALTREVPGIRFLDLASWLADESGVLRREFTEDGLHLNLGGYLAIREAVGPVVEPSRGSEHRTPVDHASGSR